MKNIDPLESGKYYHVFNRGINGETLFKERKNYHYFLNLYEKHIYPIAETFAWCLLSNHFHLLIQIREQFLIENKKISNVITRRNDPSKSFSNLFNAFAKSINHHYKRTGGLFETPFKRKLITSEKYFKHMVFYIHFNPIKHSYCNEFEEYPWSSYKRAISTSNDDKGLKEMLSWFDGKEDFIKFHTYQKEHYHIQPFLIE